MRWLLLLLIFFLPIVAQKLPITLPDELTVDLANPVFKEGTLTTDEGGVIQAQGMRLQARHVRYFSKTAEGEKLSYVEAWGDLSFERGDDIFTGEFLSLNFSTGEGSLQQGRGSFGLWYAGGDLIHLCQDGSYTIDNGFVTTCEDKDNEWALRAKKVCITPCGYINAHNVTIWLGKTPVFWLPHFQTDLHSWRDSPMEYRNEVGGAEGTRLGIRYRFFSKQDFRAYLRAEYLLLRGPAIGVETEYEPCNSSTRAYTQSYIAQDHSLADPSEKLRWRLAGHYEGCPLKDRITQARLDYDWLSDPELASDYRLDDFNLHTARQTQLELIQQAPNVTFNSFVRVRVNTFQTINQELPTFRASSRPKLFGATGVIAATRASIGYQDFVFARPSKEKGFHSSRLFLNERLYRPFCLGSLSCLPEIQATAIYYNQSQHHDGQLLASCQGNFETHFRLFRLFGPCKHVLEPYARYTYATTPSSLIPNHYVFSSEDAYTHLSYLRFGARNFLHTRGASNNRPFACDLFAYAFFSTPTIVGSIPRLYTDLSWHVRQDLTTQVQAGWNFSHSQVDHFRSRLSMTVSEDFAFSLEFRYRSAFEYLKADPFNWVLDSFRPESALLDSPLSDRRCTVLTDFFLRITPTMAIQLETHHGFKRRHAAPYNEAKVTFYKIFRCRWHFSMFFEHLEIDNRWGVHLKLGPGKCPKPLGHTPTVW